ncbi:Flp pilus assembly protein CpaB [Rhodobium gokarnense]|uniref:Pilus assembly protein CpaB n=1 Tax=Rhodobium gokarnense TaxID=364296 RepID=A0ABT3H801_9HYPH|nr:Flp pilus assembly protein CpaB [Rhodobium gokarnense]MCW2306515.1 pilus assembly protein CpaB [Rhodobium gokarnense]
MKVTRIIVLAVALGAGLIAAMLLMNMVGKKPSAPQIVREVEQVPSDDVLVASVDIPIGKSVGPDDLRWQKWPAEGLSPTVITRAKRPDAITELSGGIARTPFLDGEPIKEQKLIRADAGFMSAILPKGRRAIAVQVSALNTAGGFILPNDRVDVVLTRQRNTGNDERAEWYSETILTNIRILAIDQKIEDKKGEKVVVARETATLELTPTQVEVVARAQQVGTLSLALRSIVDARPDADDEPIKKRRSGVNYVKFGLQSQAVSQ